MKEPTKDKMKRKKVVMKAKKQIIVAKVKGLAPAATAVLMLLAALLFAGCQDLNPASRSNHAQYRDVAPSIVVNGSSNVVTVTNSVGDGVIASADGGGDAMTNTPSQTTDVKPEVAVGVGGGSAGTGAGSQEAGLTTQIMSALKGLGGLINPTNEKTVAAAVEAACVGGNCAPTPTK
jgi:hypothetical protein